MSARAAAAATVVAARAATEEPVSFIAPAGPARLERSQLPEARQRLNTRGKRCPLIRSRDLEMITLTFRPFHGESSILVRGMYFRICADATLRGADNAVAARYSERLWQLGPRQYRSFECSGTVFLRVTNHDGSRECAGPYDFVKATEGAIFTHEHCLGLYASRGDTPALTTPWQEIALLSSL